MNYEEVLNAIKALPYTIDKADGQYIQATSAHKWDTTEGKIVSSKGKRIIQANVEPVGTASYSGMCFYGIKEDANTRTVFNGIITDIAQIEQLEQLTNSFLW